MLMNAAPMINPPNANPGSNCFVPMRALAIRVRGNSEQEWRLSTCQDSPVGYLWCEVSLATTVANQAARFCQFGG
jgi:hypothetical protein